jgi:hypothetical protein
MAVRDIPDDTVASLAYRASARQQRRFAFRALQPLVFGLVRRSRTGGCRSSTQSIQCSRQQDMDTLQRRGGNVGNT